MCEGVTQVALVVETYAEVAHAVPPTVILRPLRKPVPVKVRVVPPPWPEAAHGRERGAIIIGEPR